MNSKIANSAPTINGLSIEYLLIAIFVSLLIVKRSARSVLNSLRDKGSKNDFNGYNSDRYEVLPGPLQLPIIGALHYLAMTDFRNTIKMLRDFADMYGPIARFKLFSEEFVVLNNAPMAHALLSSTDMGHFQKTPFFYDIALGQILGNGLITSTGHHWKSQRKLLSPAFSHKSMQNYCKIFIKSSKKLMKDLDELFKHTPEGQTQQINTVINCCGLQIITESVMGLELYNNEDGLKFYTNIKRSKELFATRLHKPILLLDFFWRFHPLSKEYDQVVENLNAITKNMIGKKQLTKSDLERDKTSEKNFDEYENNNVSLATNGKTMIDEMLRANMSDTDILYEVNTMVFAGFETTSALVHYLMFLLALNSEQQQLCREEIDRVLCDPMACPNGELTFEALADLRYLDRCLSETLRFFPPVFIVMRKLETPLKLNKTLRIPAGVNVAVPTFTIHKNPEYFPEPEKFDPDRFLPENVKARHPGAYLPFSAGPRICMGAKFATIAAKVMAAQILRHFYVHTTDSMNSVASLPNIFMTPERDYNFILKRRGDIFES